MHTILLVPKLFLCIFMVLFLCSESVAKDWHESALEDTKEDFQNIHRIVNNPLNKQVMSDVEKYFKAMDQVIIAMPPGAEKDRALKAFNQLHKDYNEVFKPIKKAIEYGDHAQNALEFGTRLSKMSELQHDDPTAAMQLLADVAEKYGDNVPLVGRFIKGYGKVTGELLQACRGLQNKLDEKFREGQFGAGVHGHHGEQWAQFKALDDKYHGYLWEPLSNAPIVYRTDGIRERLIWDSNNQSFYEVPRGVDIGHLYQMRVLADAPRDGNTLKMAAERWDKFVAEEEKARDLYRQLSALELSSDFRWYRMDYFDSQYSNDADSFAAMYVHNTAERENIKSGLEDLYKDYVRSGDWEGAARLRRFAGDRLDLELPEKSELGAGEILDGSGAVIIRGDPESLPGTGRTGQTVFSHSGSWQKAYGGWRTEEDPPNAPYTVGPVHAGPGKYQVALTYSPDIAPSMTAGNHNTGMRVTGRFPSGSAQLARIRPPGRDKPSGEAFATFELTRPAQIEVRFGMATSRGQAGGYAEHAQSFTGTISLKEHVQEQAADAGVFIMPGDTIRSGSRHTLVSRWGGAEMLIRRDSEVRIQEDEDGTLQIIAERGDIRLRSSETLRRSFEVVHPQSSKSIRPSGTDFSVGPEGVQVIEGSVLIQGESGSINLEAGQRMDLDTGEISDLEIDPSHQALSSDGIPLEPDFWKPGREPYGSKTARFSNNTVDGGWFLADPPSRWERPGRDDLRRVEVETPEAGVLELTVPGDSSLDDSGDTAPRLLHKISGDFILKGEAWLKTQENSAALKFLARAPGSYAGASQDEFSRTREDGPGQHYWIGGTGISMSADGENRLEALNREDQSLWPAVETGPVLVRLMRNDDIWLTGWSLDGGNTWQTSRLKVAHLPETIWVGWAFINPQRSAEPAVFTLQNISLESVPLGSMPLPEWQPFVNHGRLGWQDNSVQLSLDGGDPGTVRVFSNRYFVDDFDVVASFRNDWGKADSHGRQRWSLAAVDSSEQGVAVGAEIGQEGMRYGVVHERRPGYDPDTDMQHGSEPTEETEGRLRLVRTGDMLTAYYWRGGEWNYFRELEYRNQDDGEFKGPLFLRLEASHSTSGQRFDPMQVDFNLTGVYPSSAQRLRESGTALQASGDYAGALRKYQESLALQHDPGLDDRMKRLKHYMEVSQAEIIPPVRPGQSDEEPAKLALNRMYRGHFSKDDREHWYKVATKLPGSLQADVRSDDTLTFSLSLIDGKQVMDRDSTGLKSERSVERPDLDSHQYMLRIYQGRGDGPYFIETQHIPVDYSLDKEPNDSVEKAQKIPLYHETQGVLGYIADGDTDRDDWFMFTTDEYGALTVELEAEEALQIRLDLYDVSERSLDRDYSGRESRRSVERADLSPGTYYVRVRREAGQGGYTLTPKLDASGFASDEEPNDTADQAQKIKVNQETTGLLGYYSDGDTDRDDWFIFTTDEYGSLTVELEAEEALQIRLDLYDVSERSLDRDYSGRESRRSVERADLSPGTYYVRVRREAGQGGYTLTPKLDASGFASDEESNDTADQAQKIKVNQETTGLLGYYSDGDTDRDDWFKFIIDQPGTLEVSLKAEEELMLRLDLYSDAGSNRIVSDHSGRKSKRSIKQHDLEPGEYHIRIRRESGQGGYLFRPVLNPDS